GPAPVSTASSTRPARSRTTASRAAASRGWAAEPPPTCRAPRRANGDRNLRNRGRPAGVLVRIWAPADAVKRLLTRGQPPATRLESGRADRSLISVQITRLG